MNDFNRRSFLGFSFFGAAGAMAGGPAAAAGGDTAGASSRNPYAHDGAEHWVVDETSAVADTESGKVVGYIRNGVRIFQGIPYGEILSREARWSRAAKVRPWTATRSSRAQGPLCPQTVPPAGVGTNASDLDEPIFRDSDFVRSPPFPGEDCLRINIWTPGIDNKKRQVLFYCHGGGFSGGSPLMAARFEAHNLARYGDVVVVSMTHRLNALGFLDLTAFGARYADSANVGMLDLVDALKWVRTNIANFGGDPAKVMIFGHSGGGGKVLALLSMPEAKGLFNRAVAQSGAPLPFSTPEQGAARTASFLKVIEVSPNSIDALHKLPGETLMRGVAAVRAANFQAQERYDLASKSITDWAPIVDGRTMLFDPTSPAVSSDVPLIIGNAQHEFYSALGHPEYVQMKEVQARDLVRTFFGPSGDDIYDVYKRAFPKVSPFEVSAMARATGRMRAASVKVAQRRSAFNAAPTYNYCVHWRANNFEGRGMAHHEVEMALVYLNSDAVPMATGGTAEARTLSLKMADSWLAFAHTGNPNTKALPNWNPVTPNAMTTMIFDNSCRMDHGSDLAAVEMAWKSRYPNG